MIPNLLVLRSLTLKECLLTTTGHTFQEFYKFIQQIFVVFFPPSQISLMIPLKKVGNQASGPKGTADLPVQVLRMMQWSMMGLQLTVISKQWWAL